MNRVARLLMLLILYQLPVLLIFTGILDYEHRYWLLAITSGVIIIYVFLRKYSLTDLGFKTKNLKKDLALNGIFCIAISVLLFTFYLCGLIRQPTIPEWKLFFVFYVFISSPLQEFLFRSLVFHELKLAGINNFSQVIISTINFSLIHIIYHDWTTYLAAFTAGLFLALIYNKTRSIYGVSVSHAVIGAVSIYIGLV